MHLVHPRNLPSEPGEGGGEFRTLLPPEVGGALGIYLVTITRSEPHAHEKEDQVYIIQSGRGTIEIDGERRDVGPGDLVYIPRGARHYLESLDDQPMTFYSLMHGTA